jgi:hypothetical protein
VHNDVTRRVLDGREVFLHRKGAAPAERDQPTVVLGTRGTVSAVMLGAGDEESLCCVAHGAGRRLKRSDAIARFKDRHRRAELTRTALGGRVICDDPELLYAEHPDAYKDVDPVIDALEAAGAARRVALLRFLRRRVGRPWDAVYGEMRAHLAPKNAVQMHVVQHLFQYVDRNVVVHDGQICSSRPYFWLSGAPRPLYDDGRTFYVCPETGRLCRPKARPPWRVRTPKAPDPDRLEAPDGRLCLRLDGQWYAISRARIPAPTHEPAPRDAVFHLPADATPVERRRALYGDGSLYARTKRQLSHAELRALGLR